MSMVADGVKEEGAVGREEAECRRTDFLKWSPKQFCNLQAPGIYDCDLRVER